MNQSKQNPVVVVMVAGNVTGIAVARRFASEVYTACVSRRNEEKLQPLIQSIEEAGGQARAFGADARKEEQVQAMFRTVEEEIGPIEVFVFNIGGNVKFPLEETTSRVYYKVREMGCFGGFLGSLTPQSQGASPPDPFGNLWVCTQKRFFRFLTLRTSCLQGLISYSTPFLFVCRPVGGYRGI